MCGSASWPLSCSTSLTLALPTLGLLRPSYDGFLTGNLPARTVCEPYVGSAPAVVSTHCSKIMVAPAQLNPKEAISPRNWQDGNTNSPSWFTSVNPTRLAGIYRTPSAGERPVRAVYSPTPARMVSTRCCQPMLDESPGILKPGKLPNCDRPPWKLNTARPWRKDRANIVTWAGGLHELGFPPCTFDIVHGTLRPRAPGWPKALAAGQTHTR